MILVEKYFKESLIRLGKFRCPVTHPSFENTGPAQGFLIVFPREPVEITQAGKAPVIANPNVLMFYNKDQEYRRRKISNWGDRCEFFEVDHALLVESVKRFYPAVEDHFDEPFRFVSRNVSDHLYLQQRQLVDRASHLNHSNDRLAWEENSIQLINRAIEESFVGCIQNHELDEVKTNHLDLVFDAQSYICVNFRQNISLEEIASAIESSPFHLCRVFSKVTGISIHQFLTRLRMRAGLEMVSSGEDLTSVALDLGYSSHSHFTSVFRRSFGVTPKQWRNS